MSITVLIDDDQSLMRTAFRMSTGAEPDIDMVGEAADGVEAVELAERLPERSPPRTRASRPRCL